MMIFRFLFFSTLIFFQQNVSAQACEASVKLPDTLTLNALDAHTLLEVDVLGLKSVKITFLDQKHFRRFVWDETMPAAALPQEPQRLQLEVEAHLPLPLSKDEPRQFACLIEGNCPQGGRWYRSQSFVLMP